MRVEARSAQQICDFHRNKTGTKVDGCKGGVTSGFLATQNGSAQPVKITVDLCKDGWDALLSRSQKLVDNIAKKGGGRKKKEPEKA